MVAMRKNAVGYPSAVLRAGVSLGLLIGFYVLLVGVSLFLLAFPLCLVMLTSAFSLRVLFLFALCWIPAGLLLKSLVSTRRPEFVAPGRRLRVEEAPLLFAAVEELAARAKTSPPSEIYLDPTANLAVTEEGGLFGGRRVLILGAPLLDWLTVDELRAGIAHELGHFAGGDTRLNTFSVQAHALFASVLQGVERDPFKAGTHHLAIEGGFQVAQALGQLLVRGYGRVFLYLTRPFGRQQELAADSLSAQLVGAAAAQSALEKVSIDAPLYAIYLQHEVGFAMTRGAFPTDLAAGFARLRDVLLEKEGGRRFVERVRTEKTDAFDTHPALADRLRALAGHPPLQGTVDERPAHVLLADRAAFERSVLEATRERLIRALISDGRKVTSLVELPWSRIPDEIYAPAAKESARRMAERLHPLFPNATTMTQMFSAVWRRLDDGGMADVAERLAPGLLSLPREEAARRIHLICLDALATVLQGALLECGANVEESFGESSLVLRFGDERVDVMAEVRLLAKDPDAGRSAVNRWAERLNVA